jgi:hypothetical protein
MLSIQYGTDLSCGDQVGDQFHEASTKIWTESNNSSLINYATNILKTRTGSICTLCQQSDDTIDQPHYTSMPLLCALNYTVIYARK